MVGWTVSLSEPIFTEGSTELVNWKDGWTIVSRLLELLHLPNPLCLF